MPCAGKGDFCLVVRKKDGSVIQQVVLFTHEDFAKHLADILVVDGADRCEIYEGKQWRYGDFTHKPTLTVKR